MTLDLSLTERPFTLRYPIQDLLDLFLAAAAQAKRRLIRQNDDVFAARPRLDSSDTAEIDNRRAVNAAEPIRVEFGFHLRHGFAEHMRLAADVQTNVIVGGFNPVYFLRLHEKYSAGGFDQKLLFIFGLRPALARFCFPLQQREQSLFQPGGFALFNLNPGPVDRQRETLVIEGLEQVIERLHLEGLERILIVSRDEDDGGNLPEINLLQHVEAAHLRHLHVQKKQVGRVSLNQPDGLRPPAAFTYQIHVGA